MERIEEILDGVKTMGIGGHVRPDGDCVGSCMALYLYIKKWYPEIKADIYLEKPKPVFGHIACMDEVHYEAGEPREYDLFVTCDVSAPDRLAVASDYFASAKKTVCIDHHVSNPGFADVNHVHGEISSASEVLYKLLNKEKIDLDIATAIYTGMIHDTGVFQYSSTSPDTMRIAGDLMEKGVDFSKSVSKKITAVPCFFAFMLIPFLFVFVIGGGKTAKIKNPSAEGIDRGSVWDIQDYINFFPMICTVSRN